MATIYLPVRAIKAEDITRNHNLLIRTVKAAGHQIGFEIIGSYDDFMTSTGRLVISGNLKPFKDVSFIIHGMTKDVYLAPGADMSTLQGLTVLQAYADVANTIGAHYIHVHGGVIRTNKEDKTPKLQSVRENLLRVLKKTMANIGVEVLCYPIFGDNTNDPAQVLEDCVESVDDCLKVVGGTDLKVTLDTCHYADAFTPGAINLMRPTLSLGNYLYHIHLSDIGFPYWMPNGQLREEGLIPGTGRIGSERFNSFLKFLKVHRPDVSICIEVRCADHNNPVEVEASVKKVIEWLS